MTKPVLSWGDWKNNAEMIADVMAMGYIHGRVLDPTYGQGAFWTKRRPAKRSFVVHDLYTLDGVDIRDLPHKSASFDSVVIDLPYAMRGKATPSFDGKYGVDEYTSVRERMQLMYDGMDECWRVLKLSGYLMIKCQNQVVSGRVVWQTDLLTRHATNLGMYKVAEFYLRSDPRPQPARTKKCHNCNGGSVTATYRNILGDCVVCNNTGREVGKQQHPANNASALLVFQPR